MTGFDWDPDKAALNATKHGVTFDEAAEVFDDPLALVSQDYLHSFGEARFQIIGHSSRRLLLVVYTERIGDVIRIISAREAGRAERKRYETGA
jgi:uncharacterized protein